MIFKDLAPPLSGRAKKAIPNLRAVALLEDESTAFTTLPIMLVLWELQAGVVTAVGQRFNASSWVLLTDLFRFAYGALFFLASHYMSPVFTRD